MQNERVEILLVEDNPADAELARNVLQCVSNSSRIQVVRDGEAALDFLVRRISTPMRSRAGPNE